MNRKDFLLSTLAVVGVSLLGACDDGGDGTGGAGGGTGGTGGGTGGTGGGTGGTGGTGGGTGGTGGGTGGTGGGTGGTGGAGGSAPDCTNGTNVVIGSNHGHTLMVSADDVAAMADKTYDITGSSMHSHMVTITAAQFGMLAAGDSLTVTSTSGGAHTHDVTVICA